MDILPVEVHNALIKLITARNAEAEDLQHLRVAEKDYADTKRKREDADSVFIELVKKHREVGGRIVRHGIMYSVTNNGFGSNYDYVVVEPVKIID